MKCGQASVGNIGQVGCAVTVTAAEGGACGGTDGGAGAPFGAATGDGAGCGNGSGSAAAGTALTSPKKIPTNSNATLIADEVKPSAHLLAGDLLARDPRWCAHDGLIDDVIPCADPYVNNKMRSDRNQLALRAVLSG